MKRACKKHDPAFKSAVALAGFLGDETNTGLVSRLPFGRISRRISASEQFW